MLIKATVFKRPYMRVSEENVRLGGAAEADLYPDEQIAEVSATKIIKEANSEAEQVLAGVQSEAAQVLKRATDEADAIMARSIQEADKLRKRARAEGLAQGRKEGKAEAHAQLKALIATLDGVLVELRAARDQVLVEQEAEIIGLVLDIVAKVIKKTLAEDDTVVVAQVQATLARIKDKARLVVRVAPADLEQLKEHRKLLLGVSPEIKELEILDDSRVAQGGCLIETNSGFIDARVESQLQIIGEEVQRLVVLKSDK